MFMLFSENVDMTFMFCYDVIYTKFINIIKQHFTLFCLLKLFLAMQSVLITTKIVSSNPAHGEVYLIQHYVIEKIQ